MHFIWLSIFEGLKVEWWWWCAYALHIHGKSNINVQCAAEYNLWIKYPEMAAAIKIKCLNERTNGHKMMAYGFIAFHISHFSYSIQFNSIHTVQFNYYYNSLTQTTNINFHCLPIT